MQFLIPCEASGKKAMAILRKIVGGGDNGGIGTHSNTLLLFTFKSLLRNLLTQFFGTKTNSNSDDASHGVSLGWWIYL